MSEDAFAMAHGYVGWPHLFEQVNQHTFEMLVTYAGLKPESRLADVGAGCLGTGRRVIPYIGLSNYACIEPSQWLIETGAMEIGIEVGWLNWSRFDDFGISRLGTFDVVLAQSIFTHTSQAQAALLMKEAAAALKPDGVFLFNYYRTEGPDSDEPGWTYPAGISMSDGLVKRLAAAAGLKVEFLGEQGHPAHLSWVKATIGADQLEAVLYASYEHPNLNRVTGLLDRFLIPSHVYGKGQWRGFGEKLIKVYEAARDLTDASHILFIDAYDVMVIGSVWQIMERFKKFNHPWVCMAEVNCWPDGNRCDQFPESPTPWRFLNSGSYLAERTYLLEHMGAWGGASINPTVDDQRFLIDHFLAEPGVIKLDYGCELFQSLLGGFHLFQMEDGILKNGLTHTEPLILHDNGGADISRHDWLWRH